MIPSSFTLFPGPLSFLKGLLTTSKNTPTVGQFENSGPQHLAQLRYLSGEQIQLEDAETMAVFLREFHLLLCPPGWTAQRIGLDVSLTSTRFKGNILMDTSKFVGDTLYFEYLKTDKGWSLNSWTLSAYLDKHNNVFPSAPDTNLIPQLSTLVDNTLSNLAVQNAEFGIWTRPIVVKSAHEKLALLNDR